MKTIEDQKIQSHRIFCHLLDAGQPQWSGLGGEEEQARHLLTKSDFKKLKLKQ
jgi:hypothetical protein